MMTSQRHPSGRSLMIQIRLRHTLGRLTADEYACTLRDFADALAARQLAARPALNALATHPRISATLVAFDRALSDGIRNIEARDVEQAAQRLAGAEAQLLELESYRDALAELASARAALEGHVGAWKLEHFAGQATLRALRTTVEVTGAALVRDGFPSRARALVRVVLRELTALSEPAREQVPCRACATKRPAPGASHVGELERLPSEHSALGRQLACDRATELAWSARKRGLNAWRVTGAGSPSDELARAARAVSERARAIQGALASAVTAPPSAQSSEDPA